jgi:transposase-like protein
MNCPHCSYAATTQRSGTTSLGYKVFCCRDCHRIFNERTATPFNHLQFPTDIVLLVVLWSLRYIQGSSMRARRGLTEMFLVRGFEFNKETLCDRSSKRLGTKVCPSDR